MIDLPEYMLMGSIASLFISNFLVLAFVVPLQFKQAQVKNGLLVLRKLLLIEGLTFLLTGGVAEYFLVRGFYRVLTENIEANFISSLLVFIFCMGYLILAICAYQIYHFKYIDEFKKV